MAQTNNATAFAEIIKFEDKADGTLLVYGKATDDTLDSDQQVCDPAWLSKAMPDWFKYGNIREQHSQIAAGVATEYEAKGSQHFITAHVVDPSSVTKVKAGVLKGFSIGIRGARVAKDNKALGGRIVDGEIVEVSLVDRPANPSCTLVMAKSIGNEVVQVEELNETKTITATDLINTAKEIAGDVKKFDQAFFDQARQGLAGLLAVEANELGDGSDESRSVALLLSAIHALFEFHEGEAAEGEVMSMEDTPEEESLEMADAPDKEEPKKEPVEEPVEEKADADEKMCKDCGKSEDDCKCAEGGFVAEEKSTKADLTDLQLRELITEVVKSILTNSTVSEDAITKADDSQRIKELESELATVKALAAPTGPSRLVTKTVDAKNNSSLLAKQYRAKAKATLDKSLATGYLQLARDLESSENN